MQGLYPLTSLQAKSQLPRLGDQLFNPLKGTVFETMLDSAVPTDQCPASLVWQIPKETCHFHFGAQSQVCPDIHTFFTERLYDPEDGLRIIRNAIPDKVARIEKEINLVLTAESMHDFYFKMDEVIVAKYGATDEADLELYEAAAIVSNFILCSNFSSKRRPDIVLAYRYL